MIQPGSLSQRSAGGIIISIYGVAGQITSAKQLSNADRLTALLLNIYCDGAMDITTCVVTAKYPLERTVGNVKGNVGIYISILGASVNLRHVGYAVQIELNLSIHLGILTATIGLINGNRAGVIHIFISRYHC